MPRQEIIDKLNDLTSDYRFINVLAVINTIEFCENLSNPEKDLPFEIFNYNEYKFLLGLWLKNHTRVTSLVKVYNIAENYQLAHDLMDDLHESYIPSTNILESDLSYSNIMIDGGMFKETFFYSGVGAYDEHYAKLAVDKYLLDEEWIQKNKGFSVHSLNAFFNNIKNKINENLNNKGLRRGLTPLEGSLRICCLTHK